MLRTLWLLLWEPYIILQQKKIGSVIKKLLDATDQNDIIQLKEILEFININYPDCKKQIFQPPQGLYPHRRNDHYYDNRALIYAIEANKDIKIIEALLLAGGYDALELLRKVINDNIELLKNPENLTAANMTELQKRQESLNLLLQNNDVRSEITVINIELQNQSYRII